MKTTDEIIEAYKSLSEEDKATVHAAIDLELAEQVKAQGVRGFLAEHWKALVLWFMALCMGLVGVLTQTGCTIDKNQAELLRSLQGYVITINPNEK